MIGEPRSKDQDAHRHFLYIASRGKSSLFKSSTFICLHATMSFSVSDDPSQLSEAISISGGLSEFDFEQSYSSSPPTIQPENAIDSDSLITILPKGFRSSPAGKRPNTSWIWQHGQEVVRIRDGLPFWLCQLCKYHVSRSART